MVIKAPKAIISDKASNTVISITPLPSGMSQTALEGAVSIVLAKVYHNKFHVRCYFCTHLAQRWRVSYHIKVDRGIIAWWGTQEKYMQYIIKEVYFYKEKRKTTVRKKKKNLVTLVMRGSIDSNRTTSVLIKEKLIRNCHSGNLLPLTSMFFV